MMLLSADPRLVKAVEAQAKRQKAKGKIRKLQACQLQDHAS